VLAEESGTSITLAGTTGERQVILRTNLEQMTSTGKSLMPDGLENQLKPQDVADLIAHLKRYVAPKSVELNHPALARPESDGSLRLLAGNCEIFGNEIKIYDKHLCLGWWTSLEDKAVWTVEVLHPGWYAAWLDWSCDDASAGSGFRLEVPGSALDGTVISTGSWDAYRQEKIGEIRLGEGVSQLTFRAKAEITPGKYLIDLKGIRLEPLNVDK
jgi:hypothetical protein